MSGSSCLRVMAPFAILEVVIAPSAICRPITELSSIFSAIMAFGWRCAVSIAASVIRFPVIDLYAIWVLLIALPVILSDVMAPLAIFAVVIPKSAILLVVIA